MTTTNKDEFLPKKLVPVNEAVLVYYGGKPPKPSERQFQGKTIREATFWLGIADKNYPDLVGQYHPLIRTAWISPPRTIEKDGEKKPVQASGLYKLLQAIAGDEKANELAYRDASITEKAIEAEADAANRDELQARFIHPDHWKKLQGFYVAIFKEPRKDKETGQIILAENGGVFWQEITELKPVKFVRILNEEQLKAATIWPPPKPEPKPLGLPTPKGSQIPPQAPGNPSEQPKPTPPQEIAKVAPASLADTSPTPEKMVADLRTWFKQDKAFFNLIWLVLDDNGVKLASALNPAELVRLHTLCKAFAAYAGNPELEQKASRYLEAIEVPLHKLTTAQAERLEAEATSPF